MGQDSPVGGGYAPRMSPPAHNYDLIALDLDGTLTDAAPGITRSIHHALTEMSLPSPGEAALAAYIGPALQETFPLLGVEDVDRAIALYRERYTTVGLYENAVYDGAPEMMEALRGMGCRLALATAKPIDYAATITAHFGLAPLMEAEFGSELDGRRT
ncbi:MAG: HAD hydrolase-like protein, partial [Pseudomonadota bacterium]